MKNPQEPRKERLDRIEAGLERIEVALETSIHEHTLRFQNLVEMQADTWRAIDTVAVAQSDLTKAHKDLTEAQKDLTEAQKTTDEKLNILIDTVDRIVRRQGPDQ